MGGVDDGLVLADMFETFDLILFSPHTHNLTLWYFAQALNRWMSERSRMMMDQSVNNNRIASPSLSTRLLGRGRAARC